MSKHKSDFASLDFSYLFDIILRERRDRLNRVQISSSRISSVGWENNTLEVQFKNGNVYQYFGVVYSEYRTLIYSTSPGKTLCLIEKTHPYTKVF